MNSTSTRASQSDMSVHFQTILGVSLPTVGTPGLIRTKAYWSPFGKLVLPSATSLNIILQYLIVGIDYDGKNTQECLWLVHRFFVLFAFRPNPVAVLMWLHWLVCCSRPRRRVFYFFFIIVFIAHCNPPPSPEVPFFLFIPLIFPVGPSSCACRSAFSDEGAWRGQPLHRPRASEPRPQAEAPHLQGPRSHQPWVFVSHDHVIWSTSFVYCGPLNFLVKKYPFDQETSATIKQNFVLSGVTVTAVETNNIF